MKGIYYKLKDILLIGVYGVIIGFILSYLISSYIHFVLVFKLVSISILVVILALELIRLKIFSDSLIWAGITLRTILVHFALLSIIGSIWLYVAEDSYANLFVTILTPLIILVTTLIFLFRYVWYESAISKNLEENIKTIKFLLRFKKF